MKLIGINSKKKEDYELFLQENPAIEGKRLLIAKILCLFLGFCGAHSYYLGDKKRGIFSLALFVLAVLTWGSIITTIWKLYAVFSVTFDLFLMTIGEYRENNPSQDPVTLEVGDKEETIYLLLTLFLGAFGVQNFYLGYMKRAAFALVLTVLRFFSGSLLILSLWSAINACFVVYSLFERRSADGKFIQQSNAWYAEYLRVFILLCSIGLFYYSQSMALLLGNY